MFGKALRSKHIFINDQDDPIDGYLILQGEKVEKVLPYKSITPEKIAENYKLFDYLDYYILPGLIDSNIHLNSTYEDSWNDVQNITKMAAQGGITTLIDSPLMHRSDDSQAQTISLRIASLHNKIFVDVGLLAYLDDKYLDLIEISGVLGFKGYLSPPFQGSIPKLNLHILYKIKRSLDALECPCVFCINCEEANERDLFMASPLRSFEKKARLDPKVDIKDFRAFGGGHQGILNDDMSSNTSNNDEENDHVFDLMIESNRIKNNGSEVKSPTTADLKITSLMEAKKQDEKYISEQEYDQYKGSFNEEKKDYFEDEKTYDSLNLNLNSSLEISRDVSEDFSDNGSIGEQCMDSEVHKLIQKKPNHLFNDNPLKKLLAIGSINTEKEINIGQIEEKNSYNMLFSKQELDSDKDYNNSVQCFEDYSGKQYSQSPEIMKKREGILERRLKSRTLIENDIGVRKKANSVDPKGFMLIKRINTVKDTNNIEAKEEEKLRCRIYKNFLFNHPLAWEISGVHLLLKVFKNANNCNILLTNLSSSSLAYMVRDEKKKNPTCPFYVDTSVPYIFFCMDMIKDGQTKFKVSPPIRDKVEENLIIKSVRKGVFDTISSFHLQTPMNFKNIDKGNFRRAFNGISCIGFNLSAVWTRLYAYEKLKLKKGNHKQQNANRSELEKNLNKIFKVLIKSMCKKPAEIFRINHQKGDLTAGKDADVVIWNPFVVNKISRDEILLKYPKLFVFRGYKVYGEVVATFLRGDIVFQRENNGKDFIQRGKVLKRGVNI